MSRERLFHLECPSGLAGDMFLGACLDIGMPIELLRQAVAALGLAGIDVESRKARRGGITGTRFRVLRDGSPIEGPDPDELPSGPAHDAEIVGSLESGNGSSHDLAPGQVETSPGGLESHYGHVHHHTRAELSGGGEHEHGPARSAGEIRKLIRTSGLAPAVRDRAEAMFARLAEVEGAIHGIPADHVHFHEVGAVDSIVDVTGACIARDYLGGRLSCGTVAVGGGTVRTAHGVLPVPSPASAALLIGIPTVGGGEGELLTPTGALILAELVDSFGPAPAMVPLRHGYGLGRWDPQGRPNAVRVSEGRPLPSEAADVTVLECHVDHLTGEGAGYALERLLEAGALDVYCTPVQMKKSRPGLLFTVLCRPAQAPALERLLLEETGSLGCRSQPARRLEAERSVVEVTTRFGIVRVKVGVLAGRELAASPEFEDCRRLARQHDVPWREVHREAVVAHAREVSGRTDG